MGSAPENKLYAGELGLCFSYCKDVPGMGFLFQFKVGKEVQ